MSAQAARPLAGRAVAVTRDEGADGALSRRLRERGAEVLTWPAVKIDPPDDPSPLEQAIAGIERFDWIVFTSVRAVEVVLERRHLPPERTRIAAVGTKTATALEKAGWGVALVPVGTGASSLVNAFARIGLRGAQVLFPASSRARSILPDGLRRLGAEVEQVTAYSTRLGAFDRAACRARVLAGEVAAITFTSPSAVDGLRAGIDDELFAQMLREIPCVAIGPTTMNALVAAGAVSPVMARSASLEALVAAVTDAID